MSESNINVVIKMRPLIKREIEKKIPVCWRKNGKYLVDSSRQNEFQFGKVAHTVFRATNFDKLYLIISCSY